MINKKEQIKDILNTQLKEAFYPSIDKLPDGEQKQYFLDAAEKLKENHKIDPIDFINGLSKVSGEEIDFDALKDMVKTHNV